MNDNRLFPDSQQELKSLADNIMEIKQQLKEIAFKLGQIERHANRTFTPLPITKKVHTQKIGTQSHSPSEAVPTLNPDQALALFDQLASDYKIDKKKFEESLMNIGTSDLKLIAHELGITFKSKPSRKALYSTIRGRINERIMLSENTNITRPNNSNIVSNIAK